jgi:hypothetical protein
MHGPTCIFWANLTPFSLKPERCLAARDGGGCAEGYAGADCSECDAGADPAWIQRLGDCTQVRTTPSWPRSWANCSLF